MDKKNCTLSYIKKNYPYTFLTTIINWRYDIH